MLMTLDYVDDNVQINQLCSPLEVGCKIDTAKAQFCENVSVGNSWQNFLASPAEKLTDERKIKLK